MTVNLKDQISNHYRAIDASQETIEWAEIVARLEEDVTIAAAPHRSRRSDVWVAVAAGVAAILLIGVVPLLLGNDAQPPADTIVPTTTAESAPTTVAGSESAWSKVPATESGLGEGVIGSVVTGGPGMVAVGVNEYPYGDSALWTSSDGVTWTQVPVEPAFDRGAVIAFGPGMIGVGDGVWTSSDGLDWSPIPNGKGVFDGVEISAVTVGGPGLVVLGEDVQGIAVWTSADGVTWTREPKDEMAFGGVDLTVHHVIEGGPGLVAVGMDWSGPYADAAIWTSRDGVDWSRVPHDEEVFGGGGHQAINGVTVGGPGLVAVGTDRGVAQLAAVWTSVDGLTWTRVARQGALDGGQMNAVVLTDSGLVAAGWEGWVGGPNSKAAIWTSPDGLTWSKVPHHEEAIGKGLIWDLISSERGLLAVGSDGTNATVWVRPLDRRGES